MLLDACTAAAQPDTALPDGDAAEAEAALGGEPPAPAPVALTATGSST